MSGPVAHPHAEKILSLILHDDRDVALQGVELARSLDDPDLLEAIAGSSYIDPTHGTLGVGRPLSRISATRTRAPPTSTRPSPSHASSADGAAHPSATKPWARSCTYTSRRASR